VILGEAARNSTIGGATSATDGKVLIGTLVFWSFRWTRTAPPRPAASARWVEPPAVSQYGQC
jgi:hypothetical protein